MLSISFSKANRKFCLGFDIGYLFVDKKEIFKLKAENKIVNFPTQLCLGRISTGY